MTSAVAIVIAVALIINNITLLFNEKLLESKCLASNLVHLLSTSLLLREFPIFPQVLKRNLSIICSLLEVPISMYIMESSVMFLWRSVQQFILHHADEILARTVESNRMDWLICHFCYGKSNCAGIVAETILNVLSFVILLGACAVVTAK